ncbi:MAG: hypothetical protein ACXABY_24750, partial [Candidatus Thorarchaeota archaeon]
SFMSNWGRADGKINTVILPCDSLKEAEQVKHYAEDIRTDQKRVRVVYNKPRLRGDRYLYSLMTREDASAWHPTSNYLP